MAVNGVALTVHCNITWFRRTFLKVTCFYDSITGDKAKMGAHKRGCR